MTMVMLQEALFWCAIINIGFFFLSVLLFKSMHNFVCRVHGKWYNLSPEKIDTIVYAAMGFYKICIIFFNIVPYFALRIIG